MENILSNLSVKDLKFYIPDESVESRIKRYRRVFDTVETDYLFIEFSFINLKFGESNWSDTLEFKIFRNDEDDNEELADIFDLEFEANIYDNECKVGQSWGTDEPGSFWKAGKYRVEVWCWDNFLLEETLYINEYGLVRNNENPYFSFLSVRLFESASTVPKIKDRKYLSQYNQKVTKYIWTELEIQDKHPGDKWMGEFFFNYYNDLGERVGQVVKLEEVCATDKNNTFTIYGGIGSDEKVTWEIDSYTVEVVFMNQRLATLHFVVSDNELSGSVQVARPIDYPQANNDEVITRIKEEEIFADLDKLIGLVKIKSELHDYFSYVKYLLLRKDKNLSKLDELNLNFVFTGNPGTGKTTVARLIAKIFNSLGVLKRDSVFEVDRSDLIGRYVGETAPLTKEVINKARGGILFIDEAYALWRDDEKDFGIEAIEMLVKELSDNKGDLAVIVAGYPEEMKEFLESNSGLKSRFNLWYEFPDYTPDEMLKIAQLIVSKKGLTLQKEAMEELSKFITENYRNRTKHFGNARFITSIIEEAQINLGVRIMASPHPEKSTSEELSTITLNDIKLVESSSEIIQPEFPLSEELLKESLRKLNSLIGLSKVKTEISELVKLVKFYRETNRPLINSMSLHNVFIGNPGTGKTTIARILADIYKALGLLERGHLVECSREGLVAGFVGQTTIKTKERIEESIGGMLFIDEAYALTQYGNNDFGHEAIEEILKNMEDRRGEFSLIVAGYIDEMKEFLNSNPGLRSRFDNTIEFVDFNSDELVQIADKMLSSEEIKCEQKAIDHLAEYFNFHHLNRSKFFGNARFVRKVIDKSIRNMYVRLSEIPSKDRTDKMIHTLKYVDVKEFDPSSTSLFNNKKSIGFTINNRT
jgi:SpoVK/Ycf46/Vps4 family AAA+-type ATPase